MTFLHENLNPMPMPPPPRQMPQYYISSNGVQQGPFPLQTIFSLIHSGKANAQTLGWSQGMQNWLPLKELTDFAEMFNAPPPPPPQQFFPPPLPEDNL